MHIELLDVADDALCARAHEVIVASKGFERPWFEPPSLEETLVEWRHVDKAEPMEMWLAREADGEVVGVVTMWFPQQDNTWMSWLEVQVHPDHRGQGAGSALLDCVVERGHEKSRTTLVTEALVPVDSDGHPYRRFLERRGFSLSNTELVRHLDLPVDNELLDRLEAQSRSSWEGRYALETYVDGVPEALRASLCAVMNRLAVDAPTGEIEFEQESLTPERYQEYLDVEREQKRLRLTTVAIAEATEDVVAYTDLVLPAGAPSTVWQWGTLVTGDHRGHRLGLAVKVANLRRLQADHPGRKRIVTGNDGTNSWMVAINEQLGFEVVELCPAYQRKL